MDTKNWFLRQGDVSFQIRSRTSRALSGAQVGAQPAAKVGQEHACLLSQLFGTG
jgi:hypothetical protein